VKAALAPSTICKAMPVGFDTTMASNGGQRRGSRAVIGIVLATCAEWHRRSPGHSDDVHEHPARDASFIQVS
jgi:hypothetical protein